MNFKTTPL